MHRGIGPSFSANVKTLQLNSHLHVQKKRIKIHFISLHIDYVQSNHNVSIVMVVAGCFDQQGHGL